jgi:Di-haem cytochrome c peroxidase
MNVTGRARRSMQRWAVGATFASALLWTMWAVAPGAQASAANASPVTDDHGGLPIGSELDADAVENPREIFHSEALRGHRSYLSNLGNLAFNSPYILGATARKAHISCGSCHVNGASNPKLFIPGLSTRPGNFDTTSSLFNPKTDDGVLNPLTIPSLRGARFLAPYGHDGRTASLSDFVRNVIVNEFAGAAPSPQIVDAIVVYIQDIDFLPNPGIDALGRLQPSADASQLRGQALFGKEFPHDPGMSCAGCHVPSAAFVDHRQHDVGSAGVYKTPTLVNANFNGPYFHDGRFDSYEQVIEHFDRSFDLGLSAQDRSDLAAYLTAIGDGQRAAYRLTGTSVLSDINGFVSVLDIAISSHDSAIVALTVRSETEQLQDLAEHYSEPKDGDPAGHAQRSEARATLHALMQILGRVGSDVAANRFERAAAEYLNYRKLTFAAAGMVLQAAEPWSQFNPQRRDRYAVTHPTDISRSQN